jgi:hypothetical protein
VLFFVDEINLTDDEETKHPASKQKAKVDDKGQINTQQRKLSKLSSSHTEHLIHSHFHQESSIRASSDLPVYLFDPKLILQH